MTQSAATGEPAPPGGRGRRRAPTAASWWRWYLIAGVTALAIVPTLSATVRQGFYGLIGVSAALAMLFGLRRHRPAYPLPWRLVLAGLLSTLGAVLWWTVELAVVGSLAFPSIGNLLYFAAYPLFIAAMTTAVRRNPERPGYEAVVDAAVVVCGLSVLTWTFIVAPILAEPEVAQESPGYLLYTALDLLIVALGVRLVFGASIRSAAYLLFVAGMLAFLVGDTVYYAGIAWQARAITDGGSGVLWMLAYVLLGAAMLHPSMARSTGLIERPQPIASPLRLSLYGLLALLGPAVAVGTVVVRGWDSAAGGLLVPLLAAAATALLILVRLGMLARLAHRRAVDLDGRTVALGAALAEQQALRAELTHRAFSDALTGLGNRLLLRERLAAVSGPHGLLLLDLDGFKDVNDAYGHPVGDALLVEVADRLRSVVGGGTLVRLGGDEFAVLLEGTEAAGITGLAHAVVEALRDPFLVAQRQNDVTASVGVLHADATLTPAETLRRADLALYAAKEAGKNRVAVYSPDLAAERDRRTRLVGDLRLGLAREELAVHYQPVVDLTSGRVTAIEALLRWSPPGQPPVPPAEFIPLAEEYGLIGPLGEWVLRRALADVRRWHQAYGISVTVNVSGRQLRDPGLADLVLGQLAEHGLPGSALVIEITETVLVADVGPDAAAAREVLDRLRRHGVRVAVDDFGTGYSSLAYLRTLPVDILKIDRAFVQDSEEGPDAAAFLHAIVQMARSLRLRTVAEAVETEAQAERLRRLDCPLGQGYHFSRPIPAADLDSLLTDTGGHLITAAGPADPADLPRAA